MGSGRLAPKRPVSTFADKPIGSYFDGGEVAAQAAVDAALPPSIETIGIGTAWPAHRVR